MTPTLLAVSGFHAWPVTNGYVLRVANLLEALLEWWEIVLITPPPPEPSEWPIAGRLREWRCVETECPGILLASDTDAWERLSRASAAAVSEFRPAACLLWSGPDSLLLDDLRLPPTLVDRIDAATLHEWRRMRTTRGIRNRLAVLRSATDWARLERQIVRRAAAATVVGGADARVLRRLAPEAADRISVVPNGVKPERFDELSSIHPRPTVTFTGGLNYSPNIEAACQFVEQVWPRILALHPTARFVVAGRRPRPEVVRLAERPGVEVVADVPDMRRVLREGWLSVAPMVSGSGIKNKVLEAWAVGRPVAMYEIAANGLDIDGPAADLVATGPESLASLVASVLGDRDELERQARAAHLAARSRTWKASARAMSHLLKQIAGVCEGEARPGGGPPRA
jgi:glycosyltransferase involved in cell wall biosynthesis